MAKKKVVNIIEKGLEEREETLMVKGIYDKLEDYRKDRIIFLYIFLISLVFSYSFIRGGIQLWQI